MGLFKSDDTIQPEPRVTLQLDPSCNSPFYPGAKVFGQVFFDSPIERQIRSVEVIIEGTTITKSVIIIRRGENRRIKVHYCDEATLCTLTEVIAPRQTASPKCRCAWDFSLTFPLGPASLLHPNPAKCPYKGSLGHNAFYASSPYQLPPSFLHIKSDEQMAQVQYTLKVQVNFEDQKTPYSPPIKNLTYVPTQEAHEQKSAESVFHINSYSSSRLTGTPKSGLHRFKDKLSSKSPTVKLSLRSILPISIVRGASFPIKVKLAVHPLSDQSALGIPSVQVKIASVELVPLVIYRALRDPKAVDVALESFHCPQEQELVEEEKAIMLNAIPQVLDIEQQRDSDDKALIFPGSFEGRLPGNACPSFATTNMILWWKLRMKVVANLCGKEIEDTVETNVVMVSDVKC